MGVLARDQGRSRGACPGAQSWPGARGTVVLSRVQGAGGARPGIRAGLCWLLRLSPLQAYPKYEAFLSRLVSALDPLLDAAPVDPSAWSQGPLLQRLRALRGLQPLLRAGTSGAGG